MMRLVFDQSPQPFVASQSAPWCLFLEPRIVRASDPCLEFEVQPVALRFDLTPQHASHTEFHPFPVEVPVGDSADDAFVRLQCVPVHFEDGTVLRSRTETLVLISDRMRNPAAFFPARAPPGEEGVDVHGNSVR